MKVGIVEQSLSTSGKEGHLFSQAVVIFCQVSVLVMARIDVLPHKQAVHIFTVCSFTLKALFMSL